MKSFKRILPIIMFCLMVCCFIKNSAYAEEENIGNGIYNLKNDVYHESETGMAMSRSYLNEDMTMEVKNDKVSFIIQFSGTEYMENYRMKVSGEEVPVDIVEQNEEEHTIKLKITTDKVNPDMSVQMYVEPMGRDVEFKIIPKLDTKELVEKIEDEDVIETLKKEVINNNENQELNSEKENENNIKVEEDSSNIIKIVAIVVVAIVLIGGGTIIKKIKK